MNNQTRTLERQLESATARGVPPNASLEPETTSLREAWLAFAQLLEAAEPGPEKAIALLRKPPVPRRRRWLLAALAAMAAVLLVAATMAWSGRRAGSTLVVEATPADVALKGAEATTPAEKKAPAKKPASLAKPASALAWDDALDREITVAGQAVVSAAQDWTHLAGAGTTLGYRLEQIEKDIQDSPL